MNPQPRVGVLLSCAAAVAAAAAGGTAQIPGGRCWRAWSWEGQLARPSRYL
jgi:hypothetical protein